MLKPDNGRSKSPPRWGRENPIRPEPASRADAPATKSDEGQRAATVVAMVPDSKARQKTQNGNHVVEGSVLNIQEKISKVNAAQISNMDELMPKYPLSGDVPNLNEESQGAPNITNLVLGLGDTESKPNRPKCTWTRLIRMDIGPIESASSIMKSTTGKRGVEDVRNAECNRVTELMSHKCSKVDTEDGNIANISAEVDNHPCREQ